MEELKKFQSSTLEKKISRGSGYYFGTYWQDTGIAQWNSLREWFKRFSGFWIDPQWEFTRYQLTSVIPTSSDTWRNVATFFRIAEPQRRATKHLGHTWYIGKRFCKSSCVLYSTFSARIESMEPQKKKAASLIHSGKEWETNSRSTSEILVWTVSQNSDISIGGTSSKNCGTDQRRLQISDLHFDKFLHQPRLLAGR